VGEHQRADANAADREQDGPAATIPGSRHGGRKREDEGASGDSAHHQKMEPR
jgi:hypothetical protein